MIQIKIQICQSNSLLTDLGTAAAAAPTWMASYGAPSGNPNLPSPTAETHAVMVTVMVQYQI